MKKTSTESNEQELLASSLFVPPQQTSDLGTFDYETFVESMINIENTRSKGSYTKFTGVDGFQIRWYAGENGRKKNLILSFHFKTKFPGLKESIVRTLKK